MMTVGVLQMLCASFVGTALLAVTLVRQKRLELSHLGVVLAGFLGALPLPTAIVLYLYGFDPDPPHVPTKLQGLHLYVSAAGILMFLVVSASIWRLMGLAFKRKKPPARKRKPPFVGPPVPPVSGMVVAGDLVSDMQERRRGAGGR